MRYIKLPTDFVYDDRMAVIANNCGVSFSEAVACYYALIDCHINDDMYTWEGILSRVSERLNIPEKIVKSIYNHLIDSVDGFNRRDLKSSLSIRSQKQYKSVVRNCDDIDTVSKCTTVHKNIQQDCNTFNKVVKKQPLKKCKEVHKSVVGKCNINDNSEVLQMVVNNNGYFNDGKKDLTKGFPPHIHTISPPPTKRVTLRAYTREEYFTQFWEAYPKRVGEKAAREEFFAALESGVSPEMIMAGLQQYTQYLDRKEISEEFIYHPRNWLYQERWNDELSNDTTPNKPKGRPGSREVGMRYIHERNIAKYAEKQAMEEYGVSSARDNRQSKEVGSDHE